LRQETAFALSFVKTATPGAISKPVLRFSQHLDFQMTNKDLAVHNNIRLRNQMKVAKTHKKDMRQLKGGQVLTGAQILAGIDARGTQKAPKKPPGSSKNQKDSSTSTQSSSSDP
jgi:hypothetical protein